MNRNQVFLIALLCLAVVGCSLVSSSKKSAEPSDPVAEKERAVLASLPDPEPIPDFVTKSIEWLVEAQHESGGWGAGSHSNQSLRDPHGVQVDPATTAFTTMALIRAGHTPVEGRFHDTVRRAIVYLCQVVEDAPDGPRVTELQGTQPQAKLGQLVDTMMTVRTLARALPTIPTDDPLHRRVDLCLDTALDKLQSSQQENGSWAGGTWAGVLQSALGCTALEYAQVAGKKVETKTLESARRHQKDNFSAETGRASSADSAGVELYAQAGSQRAAAGESRFAYDMVEKAKERGDLPRDAGVSSDSLQVLGVAAPRAEVLAGSYRQNEALIARLEDDRLLAGFGSNGGEEFLSYLLTSESMFLTGGDAWTKWNPLIRGRLEQIQSENGSWTGHHCITSPVFCTAAVVQCLTTDRDAELLAKVAAQEVANEMAAANAAAATNEPR